MATIKGDYWKFYLEGRGEKRLLKHEIAEDELVGLLEAGAQFREVVAEACAKASVPLETGKRKRAWIADHQEEISAVGGDADAAYAAYLQGRVDELAYSLEESVLTELGDRFDAEGSDEDEDEDEEGDRESEDETDEDDRGPRRGRRS